MRASKGVAVVTGAGRGLGAATARELGRRGYHVIVNYRSNAATARAVVDDIHANGGTATSFAADVCAETEVAALVEAVMTEHGRIDVLVCNANTVTPNFVPLASLAWEDFIGKVTGELAGAFFITKSVLGVMRHGGRIVYISSTAADYVGSGRTSHGTAKSALTTFGGHVAAEAAPLGIAVNTVSPGAVMTEASADRISGDRLKMVTDNSILGRVMQPDDVATVIGLLTDQGMSAVTGAVLRVDAGFGVLVGGPSS
ncbi:short-chain dehydrogenase [Actinosynnema sp. ALI-1.44]|uniref:SDR family oxidoreductase n=1 Tax=Actinosynnema sp. ALI-1.44 TaxID=1933779 RepID=UPI00097BB4FB|nr:SDR family oxidoreductase [Actinosynnema sp. ALI-1.44]ONI84450.1 short-chain dehydrogenase [Actinosynnema sp. ALI-1.44]